VNAGLVPAPMETRSLLYNTICRIGITVGNPVAPIN